MNVQLLSQNSYLPPAYESQKLICMNPNAVRCFFPPNSYNQSLCKPNNSFVLPYPYFVPSMYNCSYVYSNGEFSHLPNAYGPQYQGLTSEGYNAKHLSMPPSQIQSGDPIKSEQIQKGKKDSFEKKNYLVELKEDESLQKMESSLDLELSTKENYKYRNVCKYLLRHMNTYTNKSKAKLTELLLNIEYEEKKIKKAFEKLEYYGYLERKKGCKKMSAKLIKYAITTKSIYSYILKETLEDIIQNWNQMNFGKIIRKNLGVYREICSKFYEKLLEIFLY